MAHDLDFLSNVEPVVTEWVAAPRKANSGRTRTPNPLMPHVELAFTTGNAVALPMPADAALACNRIVRTLAKRLGDKGSIGCNVQVLGANPADDSTGRDDVIPLTRLKDEPADREVWLSFKVFRKDVPENTYSTPDEGTDSTPDVLNPFATSIVSNP